MFLCLGNFLAYDYAYGSCFLSILPLAAQMFWFKEILTLDILALAILQGESDTSPNEHILGSKGGKRPYTLFQGHSGPVYSSTFSPLGDFLLSSSADSTGMLIYFVISLISLYWFFLAYIFYTVH